MIVNEFSRYGIIARSQHGQQSPNYWVTMSSIIQQNYQFPVWIIVNIQKVDQFPIWIIVTTREEGALTELNYEVEVHLNQIFRMYL